MPDVSKVGIAAAVRGMEAAEAQEFKKGKPHRRIEVQDSTKRLSVSLKLPSLPALSEHSWHRKTPIGNGNRIQTCGL
ncbi:MAG: hypothetical protein ACKESB_00160 [Candidatus Hodgkinia cicadicola]